MHWGVSSSSNFYTKHINFSGVPQSQLSVTLMAYTKIFPIRDAFLN